MYTFSRFFFTLFSLNIFCCFCFPFLFYFFTHKSQQHIFVSFFFCFLLCSEFPLERKLHNKRQEKNTSKKKNKNYDFGGRKNFVFIFSCHFYFLHQRLSHQHQNSIKHFFYNPQSTKTTPTQTNKEQGRREQVQKAQECLSVSVYSHRNRMSFKEQKER